MTMYVISIVSPIRTVYVGGSTEGSYFSIVPGFFQAKSFKTKEEAMAVLEHPEFTKPATFTDGSTAPPSLIWSGLDIYFATPEAKGFVEIIEVSLTPVYQQPISGKLGHV